jgi:hypothetical protein
VTVLWQSNITKKQQEKLDTLLKQEVSSYLIMNVEALSTPKGKDFATKFINCHQHVNGY